MQFTGLQDKNGNDIYEGDIIKSFIETGGISERKSGFSYGVVNYWKNMFSIFPFKYDGTLNDVFGEGKIYGLLRDDFNRQKSAYEVIGNIHQNPELLKP
jgi:uncharacterized phage protein (TIGR01671 family)